ncbi:Oidioi.mRNA.OKI2018_I69.PAR.g9906.t1.cds [Oikopleura dioica]|uniref:Oidioi.mRNA.OKI2018_I69.PAR.g9906.t1.cds n=1 Tax=Oikopleura dioica TaxID=34765 RepID=A0ABN7RMW7_OIKDI|nr:Oidioi.mRNA.OKI2018_I69.PAR.g9906.t1.cds [Oikopleura dioica]
MKSTESLWFSLTGYFFISGCEYALILPTINSYLVFLGAPSYFLGLVFGAFFFSGLTFAPIFGAITDRLQNSKWPAVFGILCAIGGNIVYISAKNAKWLILARFISGAGFSLDGSFMGALSRLYPPSKKAKIFALCLLLRQTGVTFAPGLIVFLQKISFRFLWTDVNRYSASGFIMACSWSLFFMMFLIFFDEPKAEENSEESLELENKVKGMLPDQILENPQTIPTLDSSEMMAETILNFTETPSQENVASCSAVGKKRKRQTIDYSEEIDDDDFRKDRDYYLRKNNPRLPPTTRFNHLIELASQSVPSVHFNSTNKFKEHRIFSKPVEGETRRPVAKSTLYKLRPNLLLATFVQLEEFVKNAERLTLATDGTTSKSNRQCMNVVFINEEREKLLFMIVELFGGTAEEIFTAVTLSIDTLSFSDEIWKKTDSILTDTCRAQEAANMQIIEFIDKKRNSEIPVQWIWCALHTAGNIDRYGRQGLSALANDIFTCLKILFGSSKISGHHREDLKNELDEVRVELGDKSTKKAYCTDMGSRIGSSKKNAEGLMLYWEATVKTISKYSDRKRAKELLPLLQDKQLAILSTSLTPLIWASYSGLILRASENEESTIEDVCIQMKSCLDSLEKILESKQPYDDLFDGVLENYEDSEYFLKLREFKEMPRDAKLRDDLNETIRQCLTEAKKKLQKDYNQMKSLRLSGKYETSNRFCESVFATLKYKEQTSTGSALANIADQTVVQVNKLGNYLRRMKKKQRDELLDRIDNSNEVKTTLEVRKTLKERFRKKREEILKKRDETKKIKIEHHLELKEEKASEYENEKGEKYELRRIKEDDSILKEPIIIGIFSCFCAFSANVSPP